jgi:hypothetical protein
VSIGVAALAVVAWVVGSERMPKEPTFKFLHGSRPIKMERLIDPDSNYAGVVWTYHVQGEFVPLRREIFDELKPLGFTNAGGGGGFDQLLDNVRPPTFDPVYQLFQSSDSGVEIVDEEPATWVLADRQTMWDPGSGTNRPDVVTIFVTVPDPGASPFTRWIQKAKSSFGL